MSRTSKNKPLRPELPKDPNELAAEIVRLSTEEEESEEKPEEDPVRAYLTEIGRKGGLKGGPARAKKLSAKRRKEIARKAAEARWAKSQKKKE